MGSSQEREECPICLKLIGEQEDGSFLTRNGKDNSHYAEVCKHYVCNDCCWLLSQQETVLCPICRESWTEWIHATYCDLCASGSEAGSGGESGESGGESGGESADEVMGESDEADGLEEVEGP
jgi:hypothetical protein